MRVSVTVHRLLNLLRLGSEIKGNHDQEDGHEVSPGNRSRDREIGEYHAENQGHKGFH